MKVELNMKHFFLYLKYLNSILDKINFQNKVKIKFSKLKYKVKI